MGLLPGRCVCWSSVSKRLSSHHATLTSNLRTAKYTQPTNQITHKRIAENILFNQYYWHSCVESMPIYLILLQSNKMPFWCKKLLHGSVQRDCNVASGLDGPSMP